MNQHNRIADELSRALFPIRREQAVFGNLTLGLLNDQSDQPFYVDQNEGLTGKSSFSTRKEFSPTASVTNYINLDAFVSEAFGTDWSFGHHLTFLIRGDGITMYSPSQKVEVRPRLIIELARPTGCERRRTAAHHLQVQVGSRVTYFGTSKLA